MGLRARVPPEPNSETIATVDQRQPSFGPFKQLPGRKRASHSQTISRRFKIKHGVEAYIRNVHVRTEFGDEQLLQHLDIATSTPGIQGPGSSIITCSGSRPR